jgi:hypothetical protein
VLDEAGSRVLGQDLPVGFRARHAVRVDEKRAHARRPLVERDDQRFGGPLTHRPSF